MTINLSTLLSGIVIPTPEASYSEEFPHRNAEYFFYACLQLLQQLAAQNFTIADAEEVTKNALTQAVKDLQYNDNVIDFGVFRIELRGRYKET